MNRYRERGHLVTLWPEGHSASDTVLTLTPDCLPVCLVTVESLVATMACHCHIVVAANSHIPTYTDRHVLACFPHSPSTQRRTYQLYKMFAQTLHFKLKLRH